MQESTGIFQLFLKKLYPCPLILIDNPQVCSSQSLLIFKMGNMLKPSSIRPTFNLWEPSPNCFLDSPAFCLLSYLSAFRPRIQTTIASCPHCHRYLVWLPLSQALHMETGLKDLSKSEQVSWKNPSYILTNALPSLLPTLPLHVSCPLSQADS